MFMTALVLLMTCLLMLVLDAFIALHLELVAVA